MQMLTHVLAFGFSVCLKNPLRKILLPLGRIDAVYTYTLSQLDKINSELFYCKPQICK